MVCILFSKLSLTSIVDFCTLSIISDNNGTLCNITVSTCLALKEKIHD